MNVFDLIQFDEETKTLHVKQATTKGYIECEDHGVFDGSYPGSELRRGRVQDGGGDFSNFDVRMRDTTVCVRGGGR